MSCCPNPSNLGEVNICVGASIVVGYAPVAADYEVRLLDVFGNIVGRKKSAYILGQSIYFETSDFGELNENHIYTIELYRCPFVKPKILISCSQFKAVYYAIF